MGGICSCDHKNHKYRGCLEICSDRCRQGLQLLPQTVCGSPGQKRKWRRDVQRRIAQERVYRPDPGSHAIRGRDPPLQVLGTRSRAIRRCTFAGDTNRVFGMKPATKRIKEVIRNGTFVIRHRCRDDRPACYKSWLSIVALEPSPKVARSAGLSRCRAQYVDRACGMQVRRVRELKKYVVLKS
jgi:hypothetical protein